MILTGDCDQTSRKVHHVMTRQLLFVLVCGLAHVSVAWAQADAGASSGMDEVEKLFTKDEEAPTVDSDEKPSAKTSSSTDRGAGSGAGSGTTTDAKSGNKGDSASEEKSPAAKADIKDVSDLGKLQAFKDIAVIQKRYMPKTHRWELDLGPTVNLNDAFFFNFGGSLRLGYFFRERYGIEFTATALSVSSRQVTQSLSSRNVQTTSFITPNAYYGADFKWSPIYGKMTWANRRITPFDIYLTLGGGVTGTNQGGSNATFHIGTGQIFALSKSTGFRWDFSWYMFTAQSSVDPTQSSTLYHNILFTVGWSWFFPEATYR